MSKETKNVKQIYKNYSTFFLTTSSPLNLEVLFVAIRNNVLSVCPRELIRLNEGLFCTS